MEDLLSPPVIQQYYKRLYALYGNKIISYPVKDGKETVYDLLADNEAGYAARSV